jgi:hypothetical protein
MWCVAVDRSLLCGAWFQLLASKMQLTPSQRLYRKELPQIVNGLSGTGMLRAVAPQTV